MTALALRYFTLSGANDSQNGEMLFGIKFGMPRIYRDTFTELETFPNSSSLSAKSLK
jgi:hypothetical protein